MMANPLLVILAAIVCNQDAYRFPKDRAIKEDLETTATVISRSVAAAKNLDLGTPDYAQFKLVTKREDKQGQLRENVIVNTEYMEMASDAVKKAAKDSHYLQLKFRSFVFNPQALEDITCKRCESMTCSNPDDCRIKTASDQRIGAVTCLRSKAEVLLEMMGFGIQPGRLLEGYGEDAPREVSALFKAVVEAEEKGEISPISHEPIFDRKNGTWHSDNLIAVKIKTSSGEVTFNLYTKTDYTNMRSDSLEKKGEVINALNRGKILEGTNIVELSHIKTVQPRLCVLYDEKEAIEAEHALHLANPQPKLTRN
eukprot:TRINITY_DN23439_c0_g1_i3.p1 TRINITY_DN23439_c0_g1~~TRINITY_DN23439_c0_g1_i3.p1  ORF type:complete len:311 (+),score=39.48 TRINITY_DN23439_c0_g1_i3:198-1130(+)